MNVLTDESPGGSMIRALRLERSQVQAIRYLRETRIISDCIDLSQVYVELSDTTKKVVLNYTTSYYSEPTGQNDIFGASVFPDYAGAGDASHFGLLVIEAADSSLSTTNPVINRGDKVYICVNTTGTHSNIAERKDVWGIVVPEFGSPGVIGFTTPASYTDNVIDLQ